MLKKLMLIMIVILMSSCSGIRYYSGYEFENNFKSSEKMFNRTLEGKVTKKKLKKLKKHFVILNRQLYEENDNYIRINKKIVENYSGKINHYMMLIEDLED
ncbi:MAG: hypothetical protein WCR79_01500 [Fusobacterium sp.]